MHSESNAQNTCVLAGYLVLTLLDVSGGFFTCGAHWVGRCGTLYLARVSQVTMFHARVQRVSFLLVGHHGKQVRCG